MSLRKDVERYAHSRRIELDQIQRDIAMLDAAVRGLRDRRSEDALAVMEAKAIANRATTRTDALADVVAMVLDFFKLRAVVEPAKDAKLTIKRASQCAK